MKNTDWSEWHDAYARPGAGRADRLDAVRGEINRRLDQTAPEPLRVISACAGDGRDLLGALAERSDAVRVSALLVEYDAGLANRAGAAADALDARVEVRRATIQAAPQLCGPGAEVIWTRHRGDPDLTPTIREWFAAAGFDEVAFIAPEADKWSVGVHRLAVQPQALKTDRHWFTFFR